MKPGDVLQLQRVIGNRAIGRRLAGNIQTKSRDKRGKPGKSSPKIDGKRSQAVGETAIPTETIQLAPEKTIVKGITHLVKMSGRTLLGGKEGKPLWDGDVVVIDSSDLYKSRRGIEAETHKADYRGEDHDYKWFRALKVNDRDVSGDKFYVRDEMLDRLRKSQADPALEAAKENEVTRDILEETIKTADRASDLADAAGDLLKKLGQVLKKVPDTSSFDKAVARGKIDQARGDLRDNFSGKARLIGDDADSELSKPNQSQKRTGSCLPEPRKRSGRVWPP